MIITTILALAITLGFTIVPDGNLFLQKETTAQAQVHSHGSAACKQYMAKQKKPGGAGGVDTITVTGTITDDGSRFISDCDQKLWTVTNSDAVKAHTDRTVVVQGDFDWERGKVQVKKVKLQGKSATAGAKHKD